MELLQKNRNLMLLMASIVMIAVGLILALLLLNNAGIIIGSLLIALGFGTLILPKILGKVSISGNPPVNDNKETVIPPDYKWRPGAMLISGGGNLAENFLWTEERVTVIENDATKTRRLRWPGFRDSEIDRRLWGAVLGFVVYPVNDDHQWEHAFRGNRNPTEVAEGGSVYMEPHIAGYSTLAVTRQKMADRKRAWFKLV